MINNEYMDEIDVHQHFKYPFLNASRSNTKHKKKKQNDNSQVIAGGRRSW